MNITPKYEDLVFQLNELNKREATLREEIEMAKQVQETTDAIVTMVDGKRDRWIEKCGLLKQRLNVAEQRADDLESLVRDVEPMVAKKHSSPWFAKRYDALKQAAEPTIEVARQSLSFENQRIQPARFHCLACGEYHEGSGNLPCPKMKPMSGVKP